MTFSRKTVLRLEIAVLPLLMALAPSTAWAQNASTPKTDADCAGGVCSDDQTAIVVTGSRIARPETQTASPLEVVTSKTLDARGYQTLGQALNELPTFGVPGASPVGFNQSTFGAGQNFVDFLGLGSQRTLVLVNSRRFVSSNTASIFGPTGTGGTQVDINVIPTKLIDRVETVAAIGAPIYGSDAIAGTINVILKRDYDGISLDGQYGISKYGDAPDYRIRGLIGKNFADGRGNLTIAGEYNKSKGLLYTDRALTAVDNRFDLSPTGSGPQVIYNDLRIPSADPNGIPMVTDFIVTSPAQTLYYIGAPGYSVGVRNSSGQTLRFDPSGQLVPIDFGGNIGPDGSNIFTSGGNGYSLRSVENLLTDLERYSVNANLSYQLTDKVRFFAEGWYSVSKGRNLADQPVYNSALFGSAGDPDGNLIIPLSNPFLSAAARAAIRAEIASNPFSDNPNQNYFYLARANIDAQSGVATGKSEVMRFVGGLDGTLNVLPGRDWKFEAYFNYGRANVTSKTPQLNEQNFLNALDSVLVNGQIVCRPGYTNSPIATISSTCVPFNPFGQQNSQAVKDYITTIATPRTLNHQYDGVVSINGPLFSLPGGDLAFALGYEHRAEDSSFDPGAFFAGGYGRSVPIVGVKGKYHTNEVFGELNADIVSPSTNVPGVYELTLQAAGRYIWNSAFGNDPTYTFQARYAPIKDITFRAAYTRAVRAPSITEAFVPNSTSFGFVKDPCDSANITLGPDPATRAANCRAAGVPTGFHSFTSSASFPNFTFGNTALRNERSDSYTIGAVLTPSFLPGFHATVDYVSVTINDSITLYSNDDVANACYDSKSFPNNQFCALITRNGATASPATSHQISNLGTTYFNSARLKYRGVIAELSYRRPFTALSSDGNIGLKVSYQHLITRTDEQTAGAVPVRIDGGVGYSKDKAVASLTYDSPAFSALLQANYIGPALYDPTSPLTAYSVPKIGSFTTVNMSVTWRVEKQFHFTFDVDNVFNAKPPYPYPVTGGTSTYFSGVLGTYFRVAAGVDF